MLQFGLSIWATLNNINKKITMNKTITINNIERNKKHILYQGWTLHTGTKLALIYYIHPDIDGHMPQIQNIFQLCSQSKSNNRACPTVYVLCTAP